MAFLRQGFSVVETARQTGIPSGIVAACQRAAALFPLAESLRAFPFQSPVILDGEILAWDNTVGAPSEPALSEVEGTKSQVGESCFAKNDARIRPSAVGAECL